MAKGEDNLGQFKTNLDSKYPNQQENICFLAIYKDFCFSAVKIQFKTNCYFIWETKNDT